MRSDNEYLRLAMDLAAASRASGNHPFGALLVGPEGEVLLSSGNTYARDRGVGHAESNVAREAAQLAVLAAAFVGKLRKADAETLIDFTESAYKIDAVSFVETYRKKKPAPTTEGAPDAPAPDPLIGRVVGGRYRVLERIGAALLGSEIDLGAGRNDLTGRNDLAGGNDRATTPADRGRPRAPAPRPRGAWRGRSRRASRFRARRASRSRA